MKGKVIKKWTAVIMAIMMTLQIMPLQAFADEIAFEDVTINEILDDDGTGLPSDADEQPSEEPTEAPTEEEELFGEEPLGAITPASSFEGGGGTEADPYRIANAAQLAYLAKVTNEGTLDTTGKYFKLTADIVLNETSNWQNWGATAPADV